MCILCLESDDGVIVEVGEVKGGLLLLHGRVHPLQQPSHVGEPKATRCVVWVGRGFRVLVMNPVVSTPLENRVLYSFTNGNLCILCKFLENFGYIFTHLRRHGLSVH